MGLESVHDFGMRELRLSDEVLADAAPADDVLALTPLQAAKAKLAEPARVREPVGKLLASASLAAVAALLLAATVILGAPTAGERAGPLDLSKGSGATGR